MEFSNCKDIKWVRGSCSENCDRHEIEGVPTAFTAYKYDHSIYSFPAGFIIDTDEDLEYHFGDTSKCSINQGTVKLEKNIVGF